GLVCRRRRRARTADSYAVDRARGAGTAPERTPGRRRCAGHCPGTRRDADRRCASVGLVRGCAGRPAVLADRTLETMTISDAQLAQWRRDPAPVSADVVATLARAGQAEDETASRWLWALALVLLGV